MRLAAATVRLLEIAHTAAMLLFFCTGKGKKGKGCSAALMLPTTQSPSAAFRFACAAHEQTYHDHHRSNKKAMDLLRATT
jgi:hypothetical protein